ncbi:isochorismatase family protein [Anaeromicropila populeti]|uniref:Nicotinamidase-related amidase n=1 Tax=Anaeromicropila populeti TaxID=37658 RepID=A0A1I6JJM6_9FIRM|nr:isochorismatase family protein [Anaeromicropila populeti]SFR78830.1 Nicotinamidase-related amidase [Anaeromicropila populeti]
MRILKEDTMLLNIDFQEKLVPVVADHSEVVLQIIKLIKGLHALKCPVLFSQQYTKGLGMTIGEIQEVVESEFCYFDKTSFSCAEDDQIMQAIKEQQKKNIIITGMEAHICVMQTVVDLIQEGYQVIVVADCIGSRTAFNKQIGIDRMKAEGAVITSVESILFELAQKAGTDEFKVISKLIK